MNNSIDPTSEGKLSGGERVEAFRQAVKTAAAGHLSLGLTNVIAGMATVKYMPISADPSRAQFIIDSRTRKLRSIKNGF